MRLEKIVQKTITKYKLLKNGEKVVVAASGGKDSTTVLHLLNKFGYEPEALIVDLLIGEWSKKNLENLTKFCKKENIPLHIVSIREELGFSMCYIREIAKEKLKLSHCATCGILRKWLINRKARELGFNVVATGHNLDDETQTIIMNALKGRFDLNSGLGPKAGITDSCELGFVPRIKPLYFCLEKDIEAYSRSHNFPVLYERCPCSIGAQRREIRAMLDRIERTKPEIKRKIIEKFLRMLPKLKERESKRAITKCKICGEPSRGDVCNACKILGVLK